MPLEKLIFQMFTVASVVFSGSVVKRIQATPNHPEFGLWGQDWASPPGFFEIPAGSVTDRRAGRISLK